MASTPTPSDLDLEPEEEEEEVAPAWHLTAERTQLQPEEAFFLIFSLGCLSLRPSSLHVLCPSVAHLLLQRK